SFHVTGVQTCALPIYITREGTQIVGTSQVRARRGTMCLPFMWVLRCAVTLCWPASFRSERIEWETANTGIPRLSQAKEVSSRDPLYVGTPNRGTGSELGFNSGSMPGLITEGALYRLPLATTRRVRRLCVPLADLRRWPSSTRTAYRR